MKTKHWLSAAILIVACAGCASNEPMAWHSVIEMDRNAWANDYRHLAPQTNAAGIGDRETNQLQGTSAPVSAGAASTATGAGTGSGSSATGTAGSTTSSGTGTQVGSGIAAGTAGTATGFYTPGVSSSSTRAGVGSTVTPTSSVGTGIANPGTVPGLTNLTVPQISSPASSTTTSTNLFGTPR